MSVGFLPLSIRTNIFAYGFLFQWPQLNFLKGHKTLNESSKLDKSKAEMNAPSQNAILNPTLSLTPINLPDCYTKIAEIAFYKAERRGFEPGHELDDWIEAEQEFHEMTAKNDYH